MAGVIGEEAAHGPVRFGHPQHGERVIDRAAGCPTVLCESHASLAPRQSGGTPICERGEDGLFDTADEVAGVGVDLGLVFRRDVAGEDVRRGPGETGSAVRVGDGERDPVCREAGAVRDALPDLGGQGPGQDAVVDGYHHHGLRAGPDGQGTRVQPLDDVGGRGAVRTGGVTHESDRVRRGDVHAGQAGFEHGPGLPGMEARGRGSEQESKGGEQRQQRRRGSGRRRTRVSSG